MSEAQAFIALQKVLAEAAEAQFCTKLSGASRYDGINCWQEANKNLLRTYATTSAMHESL